MHILNKNLNNFKNVNFFIYLYNFGSKNLPKVISVPAKTVRYLLCFPIMLTAHSGACTLIHWPQQYQPLGGNSTRLESHVEN